MDTREGSGNGSRSDSEFSEEFLLLRGLFEEVLDRPLSDLDGHARLVEDIGADSLAMAEVCAALEERGYDSILFRRAGRRCPPTTRSARIVGLMAPQLRFHSLQDFSRRPKATSAAR